MSVVYKDALYVLGGKSEHGSYPMKLHKLDLTANPPVWSTIRAKGMAPVARVELNACVYKDKLYVYGGEGMDDGNMAFLCDLWSFDFGKGKWKELSREGGTRRKAHGMWAAKDKLYVFGGTRVKAGAADWALSPVRSFESFDLDTEVWESLRCVGDDPWPIAEYCMLPIYSGQEEPTSIIVFGGYHSLGGVHPRTDQDEYREKYGEEMADFCLPYRRRLLRLDFQTMVWTKLASARVGDTPYNGTYVALPQSERHWSHTSPGLHSP